MRSSGSRRHGAIAKGRGRGRPVDHDGEATRRLIISTAQRLFGGSGFNGVSMEALASASELNVRAIYYHFGSKRELFTAAIDDAFTRFGTTVAALVLSRESARERARAYVDVFRQVRREDPHLLPFIGMVLLDMLGSDRAKIAPESGTQLARILELVVDEAISHGEVSPALDRDGAVMLLSAIGMGLALASLGDTAAYPAMLDALELLIDGTLFCPEGRSS